MALIRCEFFSDVLGQDRGTKAMQEVAALIFEGAMAFLNRQYRTIGVLALVAAVIIGVLGYVIARGAHKGRVSSAFFALTALALGVLVALIKTKLAAH